MKYPKELFIECSKLYTEDGLNRHQIATKLNISVNLVEYLLHRTKTKRNQDRKIYVDINKGIDLHKEGKTLPEIAKILGVGITTLKRRGLHKLLDNKAFYKNRSFKKDYDFFKKIDTEAKAYFVGLILADGSVGNKGRFSICLKSNDKYILELLKNLISPSSKIKDITRTRSYKGYIFTGEMSHLIISSIEIVKDLNNLGIESNKTYKIQSIPKGIPVELIHHFIRGLFDGDGSVWISKSKKISINFTGEFNLLSEVRNLLINLGLSSKVKVIKKKHQSDSYINYTGQKDINTFFNWVYKDATIYLKRKYNKFCLL